MATCYSTRKQSRAFGRPWVGLLGLLVIVSSMGASCAPRGGMNFSGPAAPAVLSPAATVDQIVAAVNQNSARVQTYQASQASFSLPGLAGVPLLSGSIAAQRPDHFRLRAETRLSGPEVDLGSNSDRFWVWARRNDPPGIYTARHAEFAQSPARSQLPIDPKWLIEALGMVQLDPSAAYQGPFPRNDGSVELRAQLPAGGGYATRSYVIDAQTAVVREQHLYDQAGTLMASVTSDRFRYDPVQQVTLPEQAKLSVPAAQLSLIVNTGPILINQPVANGGLLWQMPTLDGVPVVDLARAAPMVAARKQVWDLGGGQAAMPGAKQQPIAVDFARTSSGRLPVGGMALPPQ